MIIDRKLAKKLKSQIFECVQFKKDSNSEPVNIGYNAYINFNKNDELIIIADNKELFRYPVSELQLYYHQSLNGLNLVYKNGDEISTVILYYLRDIKSPKG